MTSQGGLRSRYCPNKRQSEQTIRNNLMSFETVISI